jgi:hypothetical protein
VPVESGRFWGAAVREVPVAIGAVLLAAGTTDAAALVSLLLSLNTFDGVDVAGTIRDSAEVLASG